ncbi:MAG: NUDIX hydrolase [Verrucomicrobia bacterium]|nr:NUDIX hydrolase [Verrucomicrobiota bacterium]
MTSKMLYKGRILGLEVQEVGLDNGRQAVREIIRHGPAVAVLAQRPDGRFLFVRQFRKPVEQALLEVVAGNREPGEEAETCARRELEEETGHRPQRILPLGFIYPSPGYVDERIDLFFAEVDDKPGPARPDEDENLTVVLLTRTQVEAQLRDGGICDAKTLAAWLRYELRRDGAGALSP